MKIKSVAVLGAGAVGSYVIWGLSEKKDIRLGVIASGERAKRLKNKGCKINDTVYHPEVWTPEEAHGVDFLIVSLKYGALPGTLDDITAVTGENTVIMSLMNGVDSEEIIAEKVGAEHLLHAVIKVASHKENDGYVFNPEATLGIIFGEVSAPCDRERVQAVVDAAKERNIPIRVGVNSGSLEKDLVKKYGGVTAEGIVESALDKVHMIEDMGYDNLVISIKSSDVLMCAKAHELIAPKTGHPLHVGITESGTVLSGNIKSAVGLGIILSQGIGDTIRVSLTGDPKEEIKSAKLILRTLGLRKGGIEVVSCPTCGRTQIDLIGLANKVENMVEDIPLDIKVAVMGCVVNGPGEAKEADIGIAGGKGEGLLIRKGEVVKKVPESELLDALREELLHWNEIHA